MNDFKPWSEFAEFQKKLNSEFVRQQKPRIRWWGNGDVLASCFNVYRKCYPNDISTFRTEFISCPELSKVKITRLDVTLCDKRGDAVSIPPEAFVEAARKDLAKGIDISSSKSSYYALTRIQAGIDNA